MPRDVHHRVSSIPHPPRLINNSRESYRFPFDGLLPAEARQDEVFERVAAPVLLSALDGYNGTVFAFGQTGSGKTFTICGGTERYADRGLIPRAISALFAEAARRTDHTYVLHISYMEVYCETGFDLLEPNREVKALEDLPKVETSGVTLVAEWQQPCQFKASFGATWWEPARLPVCLPVG